MKFWEKLILIIFSVVVLCMSIIMIVYKIGIIGSTEIKSLYDFLVSGQVGLIVLIINLVLIALAVKNIFFSTQVNNERTDGILLENDHGKLLITKNTLENLVNSVTRDIAGAESASSKIILDKDNNLIVLVTMVISQDINIKYIINKLQSTIKDAVKQTVDLDVKEVNVKVKNIAIKSNEQKALASKSEAKENKTHSEFTKSTTSIANEIAVDEPKMVEIKENIDGGKNE